MTEGRVVGRTSLPFACVVLIFSLWVVSMAQAAGMRRDTLTIISGGSSHDFSIEIAETEAQQALGLMFRTEMDRRHGMLFPYKKPRLLTMWMKNTYISLDMVFIGVDGRIVHIAEGTEPMSEDIVSSVKPAIAVLELVAGVAKELGLKPGDRVVQSRYFPAKGR